MHYTFKSALTPDRWACVCFSCSRSTAAVLSACKAAVTLKSLFARSCLQARIAGITLRLNIPQREMYATHTLETRQTRDVGSQAWPQGASVSLHLAPAASAFPSSALSAKRKPFSALSGTLNPQWLLRTLSPSCRTFAHLLVDSLLDHLETHASLPVRCLLLLVSDKAARRLVPFLFEAAWDC
jgi:hypothetical protein